MSPIGGICIEYHPYENNFEFGTVKYLGVSINTINTNKDRKILLKTFRSWRWYK